MTAERPQIPQSVLDFVGLTPERFAQFEQEAQEEAWQKREALLNSLGAGVENGKLFYKQILTNTVKRYEDFPHDIYVEIPEVSGQIPLRGKESGYFAEELLLTWSNRKKSTTNQISDPEIAAATDKYVVDFVRGIGQAALVRNDLRTAVIALDVSTDGGILNNAFIKEQIEKLPLDRNDHQLRLQIADVIQQRLEELEQRQRQEEERRKKTTRRTQREEHNNN